MPELLIALGALVVIIAAALWLSATERAGRDEGGNHLWAVASANTSDGVTALLQVEFRVRAPEGAVRPAGLVDDAESMLRHRIATAPLADLPSAGDEIELDWNDLPTGVKVSPGVVCLSDVEVTPELRRLLTTRSTG